LVALWNRNDNGSLRTAYLVNYLPAEIVLNLQAFKHATILPTGPLGPIVQRFKKFGRCGQIPNPDPLRLERCSGWWLIVVTLLYGGRAVGGIAGSGRRRFASAIIHEEITPLPDPIHDVGRYTLLDRKRPPLFVGEFEGCHGRLREKYLSIMPPSAGTVNFGLSASL
jgi:hypothetical protein